MTKSKERIGETIVQRSSGLEATIIEYHNARCVDIRFCNGAVRRSIAYSDFKKGGIRCPMVVEHCGTYAKITNPNTKRKTEFLVDIDDLDRVISVGLWSATSHGYIECRSPIANGYLHRFIMNANDDQQIEHKNRIKTDCRKANLRFSSQNENTWNMPRRKSNTSGYIGVTYYKAKNQFRSRVVTNKKEHFIDFFDCKHAAAKAYNVVVLIMHGEFAELNIVSCDGCSRQSCEFYKRNWETRALQPIKERLYTTNKSGIRGVYERGEKWFSHLTSGGKQVHHKQHDTRDEAIAARKSAEQKHWGSTLT